jgi:heme-degrading monooxygenase HmoA
MSRQNSNAFRVMVRMQVEQGLEKDFERAWQEVGDSVARNPKNLGQWLSRSLTEEGIYYLISDWVDEPSFREFEKSDAHRVHHEQLNPYRSGKSMVPMQVVAQRAGNTEGANHG